MYKTNIDAMKSGIFKSLHLLYDFRQVGITPNGDRDICVIAETKADLETFLIDNEYELTAQEITEV